MKNINWNYIQDILIAAITITAFKSLFGFEYAVLAGISMILGNVVYITNKNK